jgi:hypothetical protein
VKRYIERAFGLKAIYKYAHYHKLNRQTAHANDAVAMFAGFGFLDSGIDQKSNLPG